MSNEQIVKAINRLSQKVDNLTSLMQSFIRYNSNNDITQRDFYDEQDFQKDPLQTIDLFKLLDQQYNSYNGE